MTIQSKIAQLHSDIAVVAKECGRTDMVQIMAVSKMQSEESIKAALDAGHRLFGENKVQEASTHWSSLRSKYPNLTLHLIGPLQSNKVPDAVRLFDCIQTVDRSKLAKALAVEMQKQNRILSCLIQVNTGSEPQKFGIPPNELPALLKECQDYGLSIIGLMCIPPVNEPAALHFALLKKLAYRHGLHELSMGMSGDWQKAIPLGSTIVRLGTAIFGERPNLSMH